MSIFSRGKKIPVHDDFKKPLAWAVLILALTASFAMGYLLGRGDTFTPIIIETNRSPSGN